MNKIFKVADIRKLEQQVLNGEISYSRMVEIMNEMANNAECNVCALHEQQRTCCKLLEKLKNTN